jgi:quercetin dioxygenase-like cupin family protein
MKPFVAPVALCASLLSGVVISGQSVPTMNEEPHHKRLTYIRNMRVFEITVPPGGMTQYHVHDHDMMTIALGESTTRTQRQNEDWTMPTMRTPGTAQATTATGMPFVHRLENVGSTPYHVFAVENLRQGSWTSQAPMAAPGTTSREQTRAFAVYDIRLNAATRETAHTHQNPSFIFLMSGMVLAQGGGGEFAFPLELTRTRWFPGSGADQPHVIELADGVSEAHVICVEAK